MLGSTAVYVIQMDVEILAPQVHSLVEIVEHADAGRAKLLSDLVHVVAILSCEGEADVIAVVIRCLPSLSHRTSIDAGCLTFPRTASGPHTAFQLKQNRNRAAMRWRAWLASLRRFL